MQKFDAEIKLFKKIFCKILNFFYKILIQIVYNIDTCDKF